MFCKNRITLIGFLGKGAETRFTPNGTAHTRFSLATNVRWKKDKDSGGVQQHPSVTFSHESQHD